MYKTSLIFTSNVNTNSVSMFYVSSTKKQHTYNNSALILSSKSF